MKLRLNLSLRRALLAAMVTTCSFVNITQAGTMHDDVSFQTYTDYGQNLGRYVQGCNANALLQYIRNEVEHGIVIHYTDGTSYTISNEQGIVDSSGVFDIGAANAISPNFIATVLHNGSLNASYSERVVGSEHAINYSGVDIRSSDIYRLAPLQADGVTQYDYMLQRQSKIVTDATWLPITSISDLSSIQGEYIYHIGAGTKEIWNSTTGKVESLAEPYTYIIGGINSASVTFYAGCTNLSIFQSFKYAAGEGANSTNPLPNILLPGDSGSPIFVYNPETKQYEYLAAQQSYSPLTMGQARGDVEWTREILASYNVNVQMQGINEVYLYSASSQGDYYIDKFGNSAFTYTGIVTDSAGQKLAEYKGVQSGVNTWADLSELKDKQNWYAYDSDRYLERSDAELFFTQNLVFNANGADKNVVLQETVDLGIGYAEFNQGSYTISSKEGESFMFNHAGYVINAGAEVHLQLVNPDTYMTEWRKTGAGDLYIDGTGNTNAVLNVGGSGKTYLQQKDGYAAYNVLASSGATVVIQDTNQIVRDFTFGAGGGTLDMNGNSMDWYQTADGEGRFTINALTEQAIISNTSGKGSILTFKETGEQTYRGSFTDSESGSLRIDYQGKGTWHLHSIRTDLCNNEDSGLTVTNGRVILSGTNTVHGMGSVNGKQTSRLELENDWHYADAAMNVQVKDGATFELGSHARLSGNISVSNGGSFVMRESVQHRMEYVEGGAYMEDTGIYAAFHGMKGNVSLDEGAVMAVEFNKGTTADTTYAGNISGSGTITVNSGLDGGRFILAGDNTGHIGAKQVLAGALIFANEQAIGNTSTQKWLINSSAYIASDLFVEGYDTLAHIDSQSTGVLALNSDYNTALDLSNHTSLVLGAMEGSVVQYGINNGDQVGEPLAAVNGGWRFGGGGGEIQVNFRLTGSGNLYLGADSTSRGIVTLTNENNDFSGNIIFNGFGITLNASEATLGRNADVSLSYGNAFAPDSITLLNRVSFDSEGIVLVNNMATSDIDLSSHESLFIGASTNTVYTGNITLGSHENTYRFSAANGATLTINGAIESSCHVLLDAQGYEGGKVLLNLSKEHSGNITVQGNRNNGSSGNIALMLNQDLTSAGSVSLRKGGALDINGYKWTINGQLNTEAGSAVTDTKDSGTLEFTASSGDYTIASDISVSNFNKIGSASLTLTGNVDLHYLSLSDGTVNFATESLNITRISHTAGNLHFMLANGSSSASYNIGEVVGDRTGNLIVDQGVTVHMNSISNTGWYKYGSRILQVDGVLNLGGALNLGQYNNGEIISGSGIINVQGNTNITLTGGSAVISAKSLNIVGSLSLGCWKWYDSGSINVDILDGVTSVGGKVHHSSDGNPGQNEFIILNINGGELVMNDGSNMTRGQLNIVSGKLTQMGGDTIISNSFSMSGGEFNINGGIVSITSAPTSMTGGAIQVSGGTLALTTDSIGILQGATSTTISEQGVLDLSAVNIESGTTITIGTGGLSFDGAGICFGNLAEDTIYQIFSGGSLEGWNTDNITASQIFINGVSLLDYGRHSYTLEDGRFSYDLLESLNLVWSGANGGAWDKESQSWINAANNVADIFVNGDNVIFTDDATLSYVENNLRVGILELQQGVDLSFSAQNMQINELKLAQQSTLSLGTGSYSLNAASNLKAGNLQVAGNVELLFNNGLTFSDNANLSLQNGAYLSIQNGTLSLTQESIGKAGESSSICMAGGRINLNRTGDYNSQTVYSTIDVNSEDGLTSILHNNASAESMERILKSVKIAEGNTLELHQNNWNTIWRIEQLDGSGNLTWESRTNHNNTSRLIISGDNESYTGTITVNRNYTSNANRVFQAYLELASEKAAMNAAVSLRTTATSNQQISRSVLAINTPNAQIRGLDGDVYAHVYSGDSLISAKQTSVPDSTANNTLTIAGASSHTFAGSVGSHSENYHLSLVKSNSGSQTFSGATYWDSITMNAGILQFTAGSSLNANKVVMNGGTLTLSGNADINVLDIADKQTVILRNETAAAGEHKTVHQVILGNDAILQTNDRDKTTKATTFDSLVLTGSSATLRDLYHAGYYTVGSLSMADTLTSTSLHLEKISDSTLATVVNLGNGATVVGNFKGEIILDSLTGQTSDARRSLFLVLGHENVAAGATVNLNSSDSATAILGLGINTSSAVIAGLSSSSSLGNRAKVFSGAIGTQVDWGNDSNAPSGVGNTLRTLTINTFSDSEAVFYGEVLSNLNLVISGEGKQTFAGTSANFNGSINLQSGTLAFTDASKNMLGTASTVTIGGATLDLSQVQFEETGGIKLSESSRISISENAMLYFGDLQSGTTYSIFDLSSGGQLTGWDSLSYDNFVLNGENLSEMENVMLHLGSNGTFLFSLGGEYLSWNGSTGIWNLTDNAWLSEGEEGSAFSNGDHVTFNGDTTVTLGDNIAVYEMNVASGKVTVKDADDYEFHAHVINVASKAHIQLHYNKSGAAANNVLNKLVLADKATFSAYNTNVTTSPTTIGTLLLNGSSATLVDENHSGIFSINTLMLKNELAEADLFLQKESTSANTTVYQLGSAAAASGNFVGSINLRAASSSPYNRPLALILSNKDIAANAVINLEGNASGGPDSVLALGINADDSTIAGLASDTDAKTTNNVGLKAKLFSGSIGTETSEAWSLANIDNAAVRTLTINTAADSDYIFYGEVIHSDSGKLNLVKSGEGSQSFVGSGGFGDVTVNRGSLMIAGTTIVNGSVTVNDGILTLGGTSSVRGNLTVHDGKVVVNVAENSSLAVNGKVSGAGSLEIVSGSMTIGGNDNKLLAIDTTIKSGGELKFSGSNTSDNIDYNIGGKSITVDGGTLDFGSTRQTMSSWILNLSNGASVIGNGGTYNVNGNHQAALDYNNKKNSVINATSGNNTIESMTRLRDGAELTYDVAAGASLEVSGLVHSDDRHNGRVIKDGEGALHLNNAHDDLSHLYILEGSANIHGFEQYSLTELKVATSAEVGFFAGATRNTDTKSNVTVTGTALLSGAALLNTNLTLGAGAILEIDNVSAGAVELNGALTFGGPILMGEKLLSYVSEMGGWERLTLITGLSQDPFLMQTREIQSRIQASTMFSNVVDDNLYLEYYYGSDGGRLVVLHVPEPSTATLSLLALAALAARRRRKG